MLNTLLYNKNGAFYKQIEIDIVCIENIKYNIYIFIDIILYLIV